MSDISMSVLVSRTLLGLAALEINDHTVYQASTQFLGGQVGWDRQEVGSRYLDGKVTVSRVLQKVQEPVAVEVWGRTALDATLSNTQLKTNMDVLTDAFWQDNFTLTVTIDGAVYEYSAEAADVQIAWLGNRFMAKRGLVTFSVPRQPRALAGTL